MSSTLKNLLIAFGLAAIGGVGYLAFSRYDTNIPLVESVSNMATTDVEFATQDLLRQQALLKAFDLSGSIFYDPRFATFKDFRIILVPEPKGRPNPFMKLQ